MQKILLRRNILFNSLVLSALLWPVTLLAEDTAYQQIGPFQGLNNTDNSLVIGSGQASDLLNVDITPGGKSVKKRKGYAQAFQLTNSSMPAHGVHYFYDSSGNDVALYFNDHYVYSSIEGLQPSTIISTAPTNATFQCVDSQGFAYCVNTSRTGILKTNGTAASFIAPISTGTMVAVTPVRLVMAGFSDYPNRIDFSQSNDFTNWTPGGYSYSPVNFTVTAPGSQITHTTYAHERLYWFKNKSFGYILDGPTLGDWTMRTVSPNIGTNDNESVYRDGILYFRGNDGHFYSYDGSSLLTLSNDIQSTIDVTQNGSFGVWTETTAQDWGDGTYDNTNADTETVSGQLRSLWPDEFTTLRSTDTLGQRKVWISKQRGSNPCTLTTGTNLKFSGANFSHALHSYSTINLTAGGTFYVELTTTSALGSGAEQFVLSFGAASQAIAYADKFAVRFSRYSGIARINTLRMFDTNLLSFAASTDFNFPVQIKFYISPTYSTLTANDTVIYSTTNAGYDVNQKYKLYVDMASLSAGSVEVDNFGIMYQTFTYLSPVINAPYLTSNLSLVIDFENGGGNHSYSFRSSTGSFSVSSSTPAWESINSGQIPVSVGQYFQVKDYVVHNTTNSPTTLDSIEFNWSEGAASDKVYATYHDNSILWSVTSGTGATVNNKILRYDLINPYTWTIYDIGTNGMYVNRGSLYFVGSSTGVVYKYGDVDNDNGSAINAYWKSKDFVGVSPFQDNEYTSISMAAAMVANSSMTVTYTINGSSNTSYSMPLRIGNSNFTKFNKYLPAGRTGTFFNLQFGNNASDQPFEVMGAQYGYRPKPWVVTPQ